MNQSLASLRQTGAKQAARQLHSTVSLASASSAQTPKGQPSPYSHTLKLPKTEFPLRANAALREKQFRARCTDSLYEWQLKNNKGVQFVFHDGPPYANGDLHIGHFMNKVLKDIINRYQVLLGKRVSYIPGFDGHGLPIEQKALERLKGRDRDSLHPMEIRKLARDFALAAVENQTKGFREYAVMGDWTNRYLTLDPAYEANQLEVFREMFLRGYIYRQNKPVYWSPSSRTALAEAEVEHNEKHVSTSAYVKFPMTRESAETLGGSENTYALIWTTTPWTLPANSAIAVHPDIAYALLRVSQGETADNSFYDMLVAKSQIDKVRGMLDSDANVDILRYFLGKDLVGLTYSSILRGQTCKILAADHVAEDSGTGLVHTAPGHGKEDYELGLANGLSVYSPVDDYGRFTSAAGQELVGKDVLSDGTDTVLSILLDRGILFHQEKFVHSYPYDWRTKKPIIQRATPQWFANVRELKHSACDSVKDVNIIPESGRRRLESFVTGRSEWCISRQRVWGVPIPVLYESESGEPLINKESIDHIIEVIRSNGGSDVWWTLPEESFVHPKYRDNGKKYVRGSDTMDVWFDSGSSWKHLEDKVENRAGAYADVCLEGSDQHRGWFQSSLLTSNAARGVAPYRALVTHGFALDEQGRKMSKSIGNTLAPNAIINGGKDKKKEPAYGVDLLRLVVGSTDYTQDVSFGPTVFAGFAETIRKIRGTVRFMLGNLDGFTQNMAVKYDDMRSVDRYMLHELYHFKQKATVAFDRYEFFRAMQLVNQFTNVSLSAFYFDISKDCLYANGTSDLSRRSIQTVLFHILVNYLTTLAPVTPHLAEEVWEFFKQVRFGFGRDGFSLFQEAWDQTSKEWDNQELASEWEALRAVRSLANKAIEAARQGKAIGSPLDAELDVYLPLEAPVGRLLVDHKDDLSQLCVTSSVRVHDASENDSIGTGGNAEVFDSQEAISLRGSETTVRVKCMRSSLHKCPRCWNLHSSSADSLCTRCDKVIRQ
ncbi:isoleucine-tRNA ligase [Coemansia sp. RSA 1939]|nr:isoleucine-tRNA ligase [Coemansia sp. RSA 1939]KAJ2613881.1 isoleucine-tRNA ligase [Coemansia sp. RSA 1804]